MTKEIVLRIPSEDIDIRPGKYSTKIHIKNTTDILLELDGNTMLKSSGKLLFLSEEEMGFISKNNIYVESIDSELHLNSRLCSLIKDTPKAIEERKRMKEDEQKAIEFAIAREKENKLLKERVAILEEQMAKLLGE